MKKSILYSTLFVIAAVAAVLLILIPKRCAAVGETKTDTSGPGVWKTITPQEISDNPVDLFGRDWMALAAGSRDEMNAMTIAWGNIGVLWGKPVVTVYVSPDRYTFGFMERNDYFTVTAFGEEHREKLSYIGSHSGRDGDKLAEAGLTVEFTEIGNPVFPQGRLIIECRKIYSDQFDNQQVGDIQLYQNGLAVHHLYIGEIVNVRIKE